jgi:hypothetical protein
VLVVDLIMPKVCDARRNADQRNVYVSILTYTNLHILIERYV